MVVTILVMNSFSAMSAMNSFSSLHAHVAIHVKIPETCSRVKTNISDVSGDYVIDPDGEQGEAPFTVYCNMTDKEGIAVTAVSHDSEQRTHVVVVTHETSAKLASLSLRSKG